MENGVLIANDGTVLISSQPNDPWIAVSFPLPLSFVHSVTKTETDVTTATCTDGTNSYATLTKRAQTDVTYTNYTLQYASGTIIVDHSTSVDGENATFAIKRST